MNILGLVVTLCVIGLLLWAVETIIPMDAKIKQIIHVVVIVAVCLWLLQSFGVFGGIGTVGTVRVGP